ncbi:MAG: hypothetical protein KDI63_16340 [Gammaproteobacteria bacterium]|nr:hypothetical protein [Gammaproteobacteria bacterium]
MTTNKSLCPVRFGGITLTLLLFIGSPAHAWKLWDEGDKLHGQLGSYIHYSPSDDHEGPPIVGNLEVNKANDWLYGLSLFNNSFGQFSQYLYFGKKWRLPKIHQYFHVKLTGGVVHGYKGEFEDKVEFNHNGFAPAIIPSIGFKKDRFALDMIFLGDAALMLAVGYDLID